MNNTSKRKALRLAVSCILAVCSLALLTANAPIPEPTLAPPPVAPTSIQPETVLDVQAATVSCSSRCVFLPFIQQVQTSQAPLSRAAAVALYSKEYLGANAVNSGWNGSVAKCVPGTTLSAFKDGVLSRVNYYRVMAGVPKVQGMDGSYNSGAQAATLIMSATGQLNHTPPSNAKCYTQAGHDTAGTSNLAMGVYGPGAIDLYMSDGGVSSLGHRRWVLYPQTQVMGTGDIPGEGSSWQTVTNALKVIDGNAGKARPATREAFVAWPPPTYIPYAIVPAIWSISVDGADFSGATITMTVAGKASTYAPSVLPNGYGENTLSWTVSGSNANPGADKGYQVSIKNIKVSGQVKSYSYTVTVIDPNR